MEPNACGLNVVLDDDSVTELEEVLEMHVRVLTWQTRELVCIHHRDEASVELEVFIAGADSRPNGHVGNSGDGVVMDCLGHDWSSRWCRGD